MKRSVNSSLLIAVLLCMHLFAFGNDIIRSYDIPRDLQTFEYVGLGQIEICYGRENTFEFVGAKALLDQFSVKIIDRKLCIRALDLADMRKSSEIPIGKLTLSSLKKISIDGEVSVDIDSLKVKNLMLEVGPNGRSVIEGSIYCRNLVISLQGDGLVELQGQARTQTAFIKGSGLYSGSHLLTEDTKIQLIGSGCAEVHANNLLDATIHGRGHVHYLGSPRTEKTINGGGDISPLLGE